MPRRSDSGSPRAMRRMCVVLTALSLLPGVPGARSHVLAAQATRTASPAPVAASLLLSPAELAALREREPALVILHVGPRPDYDKGHVPGARFIALRDIAVTDSARRLNLELPDDTDLRQRLERLGISDESFVVVTFGEGAGTPATRVLFTLQVAGLGARSALLDGGTGAWARAGLALSTDVPAAPVAGRLSRGFDRTLVVDHQWMQSRANAPRVRIVDARAPQFYDGAGMQREGQPPARAGHLPGAVNIPFSSLADGDVKLLSLDAMRTAFRKAGVQPGDTVAAYCHIGQQATTVLFAARLLGHPVRLYDGSMNDWDNRGLPLVTGRPK